MTTDCARSRFPSTRLGRLAITLATATLVACGPGASPPLDSATDTHAADEQAVYAAMLANDYGAPFYLLRDRTSSFSLDDPDFAVDLDYVVKQMPGLSVETVASFCVRNDAGSALAAGMNLGAPYQLWTDQESKAFFGSGMDGWQRFHEKYPEAPGIIYLSRAGFGSAGDQVLLYWGFQTDWLYGDGGYVELAKVAGAWQVVVRVVTIMS